MKCDNCGRTDVKHLSEEEFTELRFQLGWPPVYKVIVQEMWCRRCEHADHPASSAVSARKRRKYDFDEDHRHHDN